MTKPNTRTSATTELLVGITAPLTCRTESAGDKACAPLWGHALLGIGRFCGTGGWNCDSAVLRPEHRMVGGESSAHTLVNRGDRNHQAIP